MSAPNRRRFLTKGLVGGSAALLAGAHPALARHVVTLNGTTSLRQVCTYSGLISAGPGGARSGVVLNACNGLSPGYYKTASHWPSACGFNPGTCTGSGSNTVCTGGTTFVSQFTTAPDGGVIGDTMMQVLQTESNSAAFHYVAALLNTCNPALQGPNPSGGANYPFTAAQIIDYWKNNRAAGLALIKQFESL